MRRRKMPVCLARKYTGLPPVILSAALEIGYNSDMLNARNSALLDKFNREYLIAGKLTFQESLRILDALFREARALGVFPLKNPLDGIETDIRIAQVVNVHTPSEKNRPDSL